MVKANASSSLRGSRSFCSTCRTMAGDTDPLLVQAREGRWGRGYDTLPLGTAYGTNGRFKRRILVATAAVAVSALLTAVILTSTSYRIEDLARWVFAPGIEWLVHVRNKFRDTVSVDLVNKASWLVNKPKWHFEMACMLLMIRIRIAGTGEG